MEQCTLLPFMSFLILTVVCPVWLWVCPMGCGPYPLTSQMMGCEWAVLGAMTSSLLYKGTPGHITLLLGKINFDKRFGGICYDVFMEWPIIPAVPLLFLQCV